MYIYLYIYTHIYLYIYVFVYLFISMIMIVQSARIAFWGILQPSNLQETSKQSNSNATISQINVVAHNILSLATRDCIIECS